MSSLNDARISQEEGRARRPGLPELPPNAHAVVPPSEHINLPLLQGVGAIDGIIAGRRDAAHGAIFGRDLRLHALSPLPPAVGVQREGSEGEGGSERSRTGMDNHVHDLCKL